VVSWVVVQRRSFLTPQISCLTSLVIEAQDVRLAALDMRGDLRGGWIWRVLGWILGF